MELSLIGKNALVCGASKGLGYASAKEIAILGARIILLARSEDLLEEKKKALDAINGLDNHFIVADMMKTELLTTLILKLLSTTPIDILINNQGGPKGGLIQDAEADQFLAAIRMHLIANHTLAQLVAPGMKERSYGRIINIVSTSVRQPIAGLGISNTIRGSVASWAKTLSNELAASGITVNNILPGTTETERLAEIIKSQMQMHGLSEEEANAKLLAQIPMQRFASPDEIGSVVAFIASPAASYITGASIPVDGGKIRSI